MQVTHHADGLDICLTAVGARAVPACLGHVPLALPEWRKTVSAVPPPLPRVGTPQPLECPLSIPVPPAARVRAERVLGSGEMMKHGGRWGECFEGWQKGRRKGRSWRSAEAGCE